MKYKVINLLFLCLLLGLSQQINSQSITKQQSLLIEAEKSYQSKPKEALKIAFLLYSGRNSSKEKANLNFLLSKIYLVLGDYRNSAYYLFEASKYNENLSDVQKARIALQKASLLNKLFLYNQGNIYLLESKNSIKQLTNKKEIKEIEGSIFIEELEILLKQQDFKKAKTAINNLNSIDFESFKNEIKIRILLLKSRYFLNIGAINLSNKILNSLSNYSEIKDENNLFLKIDYLNEIAFNYFHNQKYEEAIATSKKSEYIANSFGNLYLSENINKTLVLSYLALNKDQDYKLINTNLLTIKTEITKKEEDAVNSIYNLVKNEYQANYQSNDSKLKNKLYFSLGVFIVVFLISFLIWYKKYLNYKRLIELINYLEITRKKETNNQNSIDLAIKKNYIPLETEQMLLNKLKKFETSKKFTNKEISLAVLAGQFDTNTKYLSEVINKHYHINFNSYINNLRINFIVEKLKNEPNFCNYKISYLAEISGFSSHSSFATVFKTNTGISPITFIDLLKNETDDKNNPTTSNEL